MHEIVYRNILKYMYGGVLVIDLEGSVVTMNAAAERILELSQDDIRARSKGAGKRHALLLAARQLMR